MNLKKQSAYLRQGRIAFFCIAEIMDLTIHPTSSEPNGWSTMYSQLP